MTEEPDVLVAGRDVPGAIHVPGCLRLLCLECEHPVMVAPSGQRRLAELDLKLICVECALPRMRADPDCKIMPITPEQVYELASAIVYHRRRN